MTAVSLAYFWSFYDYRTGQILESHKNAQTETGEQANSTHRYMAQVPTARAFGWDFIYPFFWQCQVSVWSGHRALCVHHENDSAWNFLLSLRLQLQLLQKCYYPYKNTAAQLYKCMDGRTDGQIYIWKVLLYFASARFLSFWFWYHRWCCWCRYCNGSWLLLLAMVLSHYRMLFLLL